MTADTHPLTVAHQGSVAVVGPRTPQESERYRAVFSPRPVIVVPWDDASLAAELDRAEIIVLPGDLDERVLRSSTVRWVHCEHAGLEVSARPEVFARGIQVTGAAGRSAPALAQHAFFFALALAFRVREVLRRQADAVWDDPADEDLLALHGRRLLVVGYGNTGRELARLGDAFGMPLTIANRSGRAPDASTAEFVSTRDRSAFRTAVADCDVLMLACGLNDETHHLIDAELLGAMKPSALLINLARGAVVDEEALIASLERDGLAGAGLDVFETEPLPPSSPLWRMPSVLITPHRTPRLADRDERAFAILEENVRRYDAGMPLLNALQADDLYTAGSGAL